MFLMWNHLESMQCSRSGWFLLMLRTQMPVTSPLLGSGTEILGSHVDGRNLSTWKIISCLPHGSAGNWIRIMQQLGLRSGSAVWNVDVPWDRLTHCTNHCVRLLGEQFEEMGMMNLSLHFVTWVSVPRADTGAGCNCSFKRLTES